MVRTGASYSVTGDGGDGGVERIAGPPGSIDVELGGLPSDEARLFIESYDALHGLVLADREGNALGARLLRLAAGHPQIPSRLAGLAADRDELARALDRLEP